MAISKFDLYNPEWLELVFDSRNKDYGAYDLRKHYAGNLVKAMAIAFFSVAFLYTGYSILKPKADYVRVTNFEPTVIKLMTNVKSPPVIVPPKPQASRPQVQVNTVKYPILVAVPDKNAENPPKIADLESAAISTQTVKGKDEGINVDIPETGPGGGTMKNMTEDDGPKDMNTVEVPPEPYGGAAAWQKFLEKNIRYPSQASEANKQGKVFLSFIVETDGHLSNIVVDRGVGYGLDDEALRVLKLAPAWKPGIQNGHKVRVKYTIPISFTIQDPE
jgi:protein TonB